MRKLKIEEASENGIYCFLADESLTSGQIAVSKDNRELEKMKDYNSANASFSFLAFIKCLFFFVPGVSLLFFVTLALTDFLIFNNEPNSNFTFAFFWLALGAFLTMFGIGKLAESKYLKVVAAVIIASFAVALSFFFVPDELKGKFFDSYSLYLLPIVLLVGFLAKRRIDEEEIKFL